MCKPSHKTLVFLTIALIGTIAIAIGAWYITQKPVPVPVVNTNTQPTEPVVFSTVIPPTKTDCTDELDTECWNTYVNSKLGLNFKYPVGWECKIEQSISTREIIFCEGGVSGLDKIHPTIQIVTLINYVGENPIDWLKNERGNTILGANIPETLNYDVAGTKGVRVNYLEKDTADGPFINEGFTLAFIKSNKLFYIYSHINESGSQKNAIEKILKSFVVE